ncbi:hypothetical protein QQ73_19160, partial [Candidatus Endoriftia persephone str. Guaymas]|nr:hypothetical protein [Candidatus Endoriftia persephone str. Guaymas]
EQLKLAYRQAEVELTSTRVRVKEYEKRIKALKEKLAFLPKVEAELKRLDRDYHINKKNYEELVQRLESARMSVQADVAGDSVKFRIVVAVKKPLTSSLRLTASFRVQTRVTWPSTGTSVPRRSPITS